MMSEVSDDDELLTEVSLRLAALEFAVRAYESHNLAADEPWELEMENIVTDAEVLYKYIHDGTT